MVFLLQGYNIINGTLHVDLLPIRLIISLVALGKVVSSDGQKRFERFICLALTKFSEEICKDTYEFLTDYQEKLHNL